MFEDPEFAQQLQAQANELVQSIAQQFEAAGRQLEREDVVTWLEDIAGGHPSIINPNVVRHLAENIRVGAHVGATELRAKIFAFRSDLPNSDTETE